VFAGFPPPVLVRREIEEDGERMGKLDDEKIVEEFCEGRHEELAAATAGSEAS
jgi:hypothetical protein